MRRSFSGNPFGKPSGLTAPRGFNPVTPANSPSGFPRSSIDREFEGKENGIDRFSKPSRAESPCPVNPMKNFMSPTISAVSKINASPRKKILAEKNELNRNSWSSVNVSEEGSATRSEVEASEHREQMVTNSSSSRLRDPSTKKVAFHSEVQVIPSTDRDMLLCSEEGEHSDSVVSHEVDVEEKSERSLFTKSPHSPLAPLDADPLMAPYDPDTNYLSPRPQFLHYRPTPRIKHFLGEETDGHDLIDSIDFVEGLSESELTEETSSGDSSREPQSNISGGIDMELKDDAKVDVTESNEEIGVDGSTEMEKGGTDARVVVPDAKSEPTFVAGSDWDDLDMTITDEMGATEESLVFENLKDNAPEVKQAAKRPLLFTKSKLCVMILAALLVGIATSGIHSPITSSGVSIGKEWRLYEIIQAVRAGEYAKMSVDMVAQNFGRLCSDSLGYIFGIIRNLRSESKFGGMNYHNSSFTQDDSVFKEDLDSCFLLSNQNHDQNIRESWMEDGVKAAASPENEDGNAIEEDNDSLNDVRRETEGKGPNDDVTICGSFEDDTSDEMLVWDGKEEIDADAIESEFWDKFAVELGNELTDELSGVQENVDDDTSDEMLVWDGKEEIDADAIESEFWNKFAVELGNELTDELSGVQENVDDRFEIESGDELTEDSKPEAAQSDNEYLHPGVDVQLDSSLEVGKDDLEASFLRNEPLAVVMVGCISALVLTLATFGSLVLFKTKRATMVAPTLKEERPWKLTKFDISPPSVANNVEEQYSQPWQKKHASSSCPTVVDMAGELCPSEMSSYQKGQERGSGEVQSQDKRHRRRESQASSSDFSTGSPSYGSFTTYEKIPLKHRKGGEELVVTPIRRSSRLLKQVVSP
ncbi:hypothetical protein MLD38_023273 [Melastoma candidum]|uniref:Uncharacterized protein n=1 Tax=Melastoma candidum TaxID=119954 RepID=A0ACB9QM52_9MYRT|nr:hypothetical protein MLD38_023273 [Melastoma candidum]